jgi:glycosyltransferase involved in cell wall biosynthesis
MPILRGWSDAGDVEWLGWRNDIPRLIAQSHIVCLPSYYGEGIPRILVEAAACGRPIVASDVPGSREVVQHHQNGFLVPARDVKALAGAIAQLIENPQLRAAMGTRGHKIVADGFSLENVIEANIAVYRSLLSNPGCLEAPVAGI